MRRSILLVAFKALGLIRAALRTAGVAALAALAASAVMSMVSPAGRPAWLTSVQLFALQIAGAFIIAAAGASYLMPRLTDATRMERGTRGASPIVSLLLGTLAVVALYQVTSLGFWWSEDRALLAQATGTESDPMGLRLIPAVILFSLPALAALALTTFVLTSIVGTLGRRELAFEVVSACAFLQGGLVAGEHVLLRALRAVGDSALEAMAKAPDAKAIAQVTDWLARHDAAGMDVSSRLVWILCGYVVAVAASALFGSRAAGVTTTSTPSVVDGGASVVAAAAQAPALPPTPAIQSSRGMFPHQSYSVRPRQTFLDFFLRHYSIYDIASIPPTAQSRFSFSWKTGVVRREPNGPDLLSVTRGDRPGVFSGGEHRVTDVATGVGIGTLRRAGGDWEIGAGNGAPLARIVEDRSGVGYISRVAIVGGQPVCRFTWAMQGLTVVSAGLDVEFLPGSDGLIDRSVAIAIAPILEHKARRTVERG